jgi:hypothetical protein
MALSLIQAAQQPTTLKRSAVACVVVGTLLCLINQWEAISAGFVGVSWLKVVLTYLVPFSVSTYSTAACKVDFDREKTELAMSSR